MCGTVLGLEKAHELARREVAMFRNPISLRCVIMAAGLFIYAEASSAADSNILAPYRFDPAPQQLTPLEQQKALIYRNQVQNQLRTLESNDTKGNLNSFDQEILRDTRSELYRMNGVLDD
jgi:hypothetical protein